MGVYCKDLASRASTKHSERLFFLLPNLIFPKLTAQKYKGWWWLFRLIWKIVMVQPEANNFKSVILVLFGCTLHVN